MLVLRLVWVSALLSLSLGGCGGTIISDDNLPPDGAEAVGPGGAGADLAVRTGDDGGCGLRTCQSAGATCGLIGDGCGQILDCGGCTAPETCGGGGVPSRCGGHAACVAQSCGDQHFNCGPAGDGCGHALDCGQCPPGQACGAGGKPGECGVGPLLPGDGGLMACSPRSCQQQGLGCGPAGDGCGHALDCGQCPPGQACGAGKSGQCGPISLCVPRTCKQLGFNCGMAGDGCGAVVDCGKCQGLDICGGGGQPNQCGGGGGNSDGGPPCVNLCKQQMMCQGNVTTTVTGTVLAPTNKKLGYGDPDPLYGALVYVPNSQVMAFPVGVSCDKCGAAASGSPLVSATSDFDGSFKLTNVPCGNNIPLVIQLGRWRRQVVIPNVACCANTPLGPDLTRLPRNSKEGDIPLIAIVTGSADPIECVLPKIGIDATEFTDPGGGGRVRFFQDNGATFSGNTPDISALVGDAREMAKYDLIVMDCNGHPHTSDDADKQRMIDWTAAGGRLFASHYSYSWLFDKKPFSDTAQWKVNQMVPNDLDAYVDQGKAFLKGIAFANWLKFVGASPNIGPVKIPVEQVRHDLDAVIAPAQRWLYADPLVSPDNPLEYTFNTPVGAAPDAQCGRVLFSDFHVNTGGDGVGRFPRECGPAAPLTPQEKVLEFMLFDLTSCIQPDLPMPKCAPLTCAQQKANCGPVGDGCGNIIQCGDCPMGQSCGGGGVASQCGGPMCAPLTCKDQNLGCGPAGDGCGKALDCGPCPMGQSCGGGGTPGQCGASDLALGCAPLTCKQQGLACGPAGDGCGKAIDCGPCPPGQTCGGGGARGQCGGPMCTPLTCQQQHANCGFVADGCGGVVDCGPCPPGKTCGGGGVANQCGSIG